VDREVTRRAGPRTAPEQATAGLPHGEVSAELALCWSFPSESRRRAAPKCGTVAQGTPAADGSLGSRGRPGARAS